MDLTIDIIRFVVAAFLFMLGIGFSITGSSSESLRVGIFTYVMSFLCLLWGIILI